MCIQVLKIKVRFIFIDPEVIGSCPRDCITSIGLMRTAQDLDLHSWDSRDPQVERARLVACLLCKHEDLSLDPQHPGKRLGTVAHACDPPPPPKMETGESLGLAGQPA